MRHINPHTSLAIQAFKKVEQKKHQLERADFDLNYWVGRVPEEDMDEYVRATEQISKDLESKCRECKKE